METLERLLVGSSRTFALSIPLLPPPVRDEIAIGYLLFRIADTIEDEAGWDTDGRILGLSSMRDALGQSSLGPIEKWLSHPSPPLEDEGYAELFDHADPVAAAFDRLEPETRATIALHLIRTIDGMLAQLRSGSACMDLDGLRRYCYAVAGIVGELCTELFVASAPSLVPISSQLRVLAPSYGEGLQLVNILRDSDWDTAARRRFIPQSVDRSTLAQIARDDLAKASVYVASLREHGAPGGVVAFNALNVTLAQRTIELVERDGPGAKVGRAEVKRMVAECVADSNAVLVEPRLAR